jgi:hypothetical protein
MSLRSSFAGAATTRDAPNAAPDNASAPMKPRRLVFDEVMLLSMEFGRHDDRAGP